MLKEFLADIKAAFKGMGDNRSKEANALKQQVGDAVHYLENIVEMFDKVAAEAVENYQKTVAVEEETQEEVKGNERREGTREAFLGRAGKALLEVNERGTLAFGFRQCSGKLSAEVQAAEERLKKIGIPVIVIEHMESNIITQGTVLCVMAMINAMRKEYINGTDTGAEIPDKMAQGYEMQRGRNDWDNAPDGHTQETRRLDAVAGEESESDAFGDSGNRFGYCRYEELIGNTGDGSLC